MLGCRAGDELQEQRATDLAARMRQLHGTQSIVLGADVSSSEDTSQLVHLLSTVITAELQLQVERSLDEFGQIVSA